MTPSAGWHNLLLYHRLHFYALTIELVKWPLTPSAITKGKIGTHIWDISVARLTSHDFLLVRLRFIPLNLNRLFMLYSLPTRLLLARHLSSCSPN